MNQIPILGKLTSGKTQRHLIKLPGAALAKDEPRPVITITGAKPGRFCFRVSMHTADMQDCCSIEVCIVLPECGVHIGAANFAANPAQAFDGRTPRRRRTL